MLIEIDNSVCKITGLRKELLEEFRGYVVQKTSSYGLFYAGASAINRLSQGAGVVLFLDFKNINRVVLSPKGGSIAKLAAAIALAKSGQLRFKGEWFTIHRFVDRYGNFPTGLLYLVKRFAEIKGLYPEYLDKRIRPMPLHAAAQSILIPSQYPTPYPEQIEAAEAAVSATRGIVAAVTAYGKSLIAALICNKLKIPTLIVVPRLLLKEQLTRDLKTWFGNTSAGPLTYEKGELVPKYWISVENVDALKPKPAKGIDCVIIDEFHHSAAKTYRELNKKAWGGVYYKFGLTGTPFRSDDSERLQLESVLSKVVYQISYRDAVEKGRVVPLEAYYVDLDEIDMVGAENSWPAVYSELIVNNDQLNTISALLLAKLRVAGKSTLCLVKEVAHGKTISEMAGCAFANGLEESQGLLDEFNTGGHVALVGTTGIVGEGVNTRPAEYAILSAGGKSKNQFMQQVGRVLRLHPGKESGKVIMFRYGHNKYLLDHFNACVKYLKEEYGLKPVKLNVGDL